MSELVREARECFKALGDAGTDAPSPEAVAKARETARRFSNIHPPVEKAFALTLDAFAKDAYQRGLREGAEREREACANVVMEFHFEMARRSYPPPKILKNIAGAIRAQGDGR